MFEARESKKSKFAVVWKSKSRWKKLENEKIKSAAGRMESGKRKGEEI